MNECVRELTLIEEIKELDIEEITKERILRKAKRIVEENHKQGEFLFDCHEEIDDLTSAVVEQAKTIGKMSEELKRRSIESEWEEN